MNLTIKKDIPQCYTESSVQLLRTRFLKTNKEGKVLESPKDLFKRVSKCVAEADSNYTKKKYNIKKTEDKFFEALFNLKFIPQSPTLLNAGKKDKTLSACFVLPIEDSLDTIYETLSDAVQIQWKGGGTGFNFSKIRSKGDSAGGIPDIAAGPVHFIKIFSEALMGIRQGGKRGGANIAILNIEHPDILEFIHLKENDLTIKNFNISVGITKRFMEAVRNDQNYSLINPRTKKKVKSLNARYVFNEIIHLAWKTGDPGIIFIENINKDNPTPLLGNIESTNPCGEQPLLPYESCNLAAINLRVHFDYKMNDINWNMLRDTINTTVHFLDNIIDINYYSLKKIEHMTRYTNRKMGLGLMGFADLLILKEIPYDSKEAINFAEKLMKFIKEESIKASIKLAKTRGPFPAYKGSVWEKKKLPVRNATITTIAPNGNTSIIGGSTGGIEPVYALAYKIAGVEDKSYKATSVLFNVNESFKYLGKKYKFYSKSLIEKISNNVPLSDIDEIPKRIKRILVTALEIKPIWHIKMQAAFQKYVDNAISKTINFSKDAEEKDIRECFIEAYKLNLKGVTIYRDGSKQAQTYVSAYTGKLNINNIGKKKVEIVIVDKDLYSSNIIKNYITKHNGNFEIIENKYKLNSIKNLYFVKNEKLLLNKANRLSRYISFKSNKVTISNITGFLKNKINLTIHNIFYYGKDGDYSKTLFKKLVELNKLKGNPIYLASAISIFDPNKKSLISTITKIPGKIIQTNKKEIYFIHKGMDSFIKAPTEEEFRSFNHIHTALEKIFDKFMLYKKDKIDIDLTSNAYNVLLSRSLIKDKNGKPTETPLQLFSRIADFVSKAGKKYGYSDTNIEKSKNNFYEILKNLEFQCGGALVWAGMSDSDGEKAVLSKCFVLPIEDSIKSIFNTLNENIEVLKHGGGTGFNFSKIRSTYSIVSTTGEHAAGPIEYIKVFNRAQDTVINRGGRQMGSMAILNIDHPNIIDFIKCKDSIEITHYNISVGISDKFMKAVKNDLEWNLIDPHDKKVYKKIKANKLFDLICEYAWKSGDPGAIFLDNLEKHNPTPNLGLIDATNPCGEQPLIPYESCNLGNINLSKIIKGFPYLSDHNILNKKLDLKLEFINWDKFKSIIFTAIEFLDNIIDVNNYPIRKIEEMTKLTRGIGLGIIGFADLLVKLGIPYSSPDAIMVAQKIMRFLTDTSHKASRKLVSKRGCFPAYNESIWNKKDIKMRNSRCTTVAPTGTLSIICNANPGIEPIFSLIYKRQKSLGGQEQTVVENLFKQVAESRGFYSKDLMGNLAEGKKLSELKNIPRDVIEIFKTSHEIPADQHVKIQGAFQKYCDSGISKTINLPNSASIDDVKNIYKLAYKLKCKGITIFRDGCKISVQVMNIKDKQEQFLPKITNTPRERPLTTYGITTRIKTDQGSLFVTINEDDKGIAEVFLNIGKSGGYSSGYCEAIGRLISVSLRAGLSLDIIIDQLKGIRTSAPTLNKGMFVYSVPDAVGKVLEIFEKEKESKIPMFIDKSVIEINKDDDSVKKNVDLKYQKEKELKDSDNNMKKDTKYTSENHYDQIPQCPECGGDLKYSEGCMMCTSCGYSKCG